MHSSLELGYLPKLDSCTKYDNTECLTRAIFISKHLEGPAPQAPNPISGNPYLQKLLNPNMKRITLGERMA